MKKPTSERTPRSYPLTKLRPFDVVILEWYDAYVDGTVQYSTPEEGLNLTHKLLRRTVGYWVGEKDGQCVMATDDDRSKAAPQSAGGTRVIPTSLVQRAHLVARPVLRLEK